MPTRVTQSMMNTQMMRNLNNNMVKMDNLQNQLATGRKINKPSDDPVGISFSMRYRSEYSANTQYQSNVDASLSWLEYTDTMLSQAGDVLHRVRELAVQGSNGTNPDIGFEAIGKEVSQLKQQMLEIVNSQFNGKYVFNGQVTDLPPYDPADPAASFSDDGEILFDIGAGVNISVNVTGNAIVGLPADEDNLFKVFDDIMAGLEAHDVTAVNAGLGKLDTRMDQFLELRADVGARTNRIALAQDRLKDIDINLQTLTAKTEDADMAVVITNLKMAENVYQASLATGSRLIQQSLIDFLR